MPSIAQQDYLRPAGKSVKDCHLRAALAHNIEQGTIFDTAFEMINGEGDREIDRVLSYNPDGALKFIYYCDTVDAEIMTIRIDCTQTQYEGLAAIQDSLNYYDELPVMGSDNGVLINSNDDRFICVGGKKLAVTISDDDTIASLAISDEDAPDGQGINITWEDAQKLIGLPIA